MQKRDYYFNGIGLIEPEESGDAVLVELQNPTENAWARIPASQLRDVAFKLLLASQDTARRRNDQTQTVTPAQHTLHRDSRDRGRSARDCIWPSNGRIGFICRCCGATPAA
ncbi:MAG: hypothetical protein E5X07_25420 [Mesorhizobium sp.]|uniref:hypothetical protein n=1 Tax=Mesorhizobium sp. TaxID=1871066 RepID=UPI0012007927|nr:hypothetical protein [Mesorhizobium sp.]TIR28252.1 MAG: hypothetical protein E5X35_31415 [Mesorhizobium sp.]TIS20459.1 MAG: hypothetical protein E5X07_25420 [Mesorhizobium sp.]